MADLPLEGTRVVDFTQNLPGPYATYLLATLGAQVHKIEPPRGDPGRHVRPFFDFLNRGKTSERIDLREEAGRLRAHELIAHADVVVEGFRPGVMTRLECGPEVAMSLNKSLVYCSISAFGQDGPRRNDPGHDLNLQALSGACWLEQDDRGRPRGAMLPVADLSTSMVAVSSILAALLTREKTGEGQVLDIAMADAITQWSWLWGVGVDLGRPARPDGPLGRFVDGTLLRRINRRKLYALPHYGVFRCRDGWIAIGIVDEQKFWRSMCKVLGLRGVGRLRATARTALGLPLTHLVATRLRPRSTTHWLEAFRRAGVPATEVLTPDEAYEAAIADGRDVVGTERLSSPFPWPAGPASPAPS